MNRFITFLSLLVSVCTFAQTPLEAETAESPVRQITLEQALQVALDENASVQLAELEIKRVGYARKGSYAALFPQIDGSASFQRTIKKQKMYIDMPGMEGADGIEVGRYNTWSAGITASMPVVNAALWKSLQISGEDVELAVEKARGSRLETVGQVKKAYYGVLLAKEVCRVYREVYENALTNYQQIERRYHVQKASELDLTRAKTTLAGAIPNVYDSENAVSLALWQLKAVMGIDLESGIDTAGNLLDHAAEMGSGIRADEAFSLENNSSLKQLDIQARQLADMVKMQAYAYIPSLSLMFSYAVNAMENTFEFQQYKWSPYSYVGLSLNIPIFSGGKRLNNVRAAKVQAAELDIQRTNAERQLSIAIRQSLNTMDTATKSYAAARSAEESAGKAYGIARKSYDVGRSTLTDLNDAQLALTQSRLGVCQAVYSFLAARSELETALGNDFTGK
ncbi:MAG: TolC family protein [Bacteroidales bacterium]|nr:TolC family protein [Bacteroidales bacterium]